MSRDKGRTRPALRPAAAVASPAPGLLGRYPTAAALIFLALTLVVFFAPMVFSGKVFLPPDNIASMSHRPYLDEVKQSGEYPVWTPYLFSGMPSLGSLIAAPGTNPFSTALAWLGPQIKPVAWYFLIGLFTFLLARRRVSSRFAALFAALSFVYCAHVIGWVMAGHNSKLATTVFLPAILLFTDRLLDRPGPLNGGLLALCIGLAIVTSHMQIVYYTMLAAGLMLLVVTIARLRAGEKPTMLVLAWGIFAVAALVGAGASSIVSLPVREYSHYSIRGAEGAGLTRDYATNWSLHPAEILTFFVPAFFGFGGQTYWGWMPFTDAPQYMGILPLFLAVAGAVLCWRDRFTKYLAILAGLALVVSWGKELPVLYDPLFKFLPFFNKFRVPSMILVLLQLSVALLAALALNSLLESAPEPERRRRAALFQKTLFVFGGIFLVAGLATLLGRGSFEAQAAAKIGAGAAAAALDMAGKDFLMVLGFFALGAGGLWMFTRGSLPSNVALPLLVVVTLADLWLVGGKPAHYQDPGSSAGLFQPTGTVEFLKKDSDLFRILPLNAPLAPSPNWWAWFRLYNAHGYHPAKLKVYQDMLDDQGPLGLTRPLQRGNFNFLRAANVKYLIISQSGLDSPGLTTVNQAQGMTQGGQRAAEYTYRVNEWLPRAFFVDRYRVVADAKSQLSIMADKSWDPAAEVLLTQEPGASIQPAAGSSVRMTDYRPNHLKAEVDATGTNLLYLSEVWYPLGWKARIDGQDATILRANYGFRALVVPPGHHTVTMDFADPAYARGRMMSMASYGVIVLTILAGMVIDRRRPRPEGTPAA